MKNMLMVAILMFVQSSFAAPAAHEVKPANRETHLLELTKDASYKEAREKIKTGKELSAKEKSTLTKLTSDALAGSSVSSVNIQLLVLLKPELLADLKAKSDILKSNSATKEQKDLAELDLQVLDSGARVLDVNSATVKTDIEILETVAKVENYPNSSVLTFKADFKKALDNSRPAIKAGEASVIEKAVLTGSKNKFDAKKLKELC